MLTVDYRRLGVRPGERVLDLGSGLGRHAFEAARLGAHVVMADRNDADLRAAADTVTAMRDAGEIAGDAAAGQADAVALPFPDGVFDRIIAAEVLEHVPDDGAAVAELVRVLRPGGTLAVTVPSWFPEQVCWALADDYHAPAVPGGHLRIYAEWQVRALLRSAGLRPGYAHRVHALHTPYWWLRCLLGPQDDRPLPVRAYHRLLVWDLTHAPLATRAAERLLAPVLGKSLVVYARKPDPTRPEAERVAAGVAVPDRSGGTR